MEFLKLFNIKQLSQGFNFMYVIWFILKNRVNYFNWFKKDSAILKPLEYHQQPAIMPDDSEFKHIKVLSNIREVDPIDWNTCAGTDDPFVCHAWQTNGSSVPAQVFQSMGSTSLMLLNTLMCLNSLSSGIIAGCWWYSRGFKIALSFLNQLK